MPMVICTWMPSALRAKLVILLGGVALDHGYTAQQAAQAEEADKAGGDVSDEL